RRRERGKADPTQALHSPKVAHPARLNQSSRFGIRIVNSDLAFSVWGLRPPRTRRSEPRRFRGPMMPASVRTCPTPRSAHLAGAALGTDATLEPLNAGAAE